MDDVREVLAHATRRLAAAGVTSPRVDAELLLAAVCDVPRGRLMLLDAVPAVTAGIYEDHVARRIAREPLQHILGTAPFRHVLLEVGPGVFVPRPETELLVDAVLPQLRSVAGPLVVDLCSGSGALAVAIADEVPTARVLAVEQSLAATQWLLRNVSGTRVQVITGDVRDPELLRAMQGQADVVVANPPYVPVPTQVAPEVLADPREAVFAGTDGLALIPAVIARAAVLLRPGGVFAMEHDDSHADAVPALLVTDGRWVDVSEHDDLTGRPRYVVATRH